MSKGLFLRIFVCIGFFGFCLYSYIDMQNEITKLRIRIPKLTKEVRRIEEENTRFLYEIEAFESPENLMKLAASAEFSHMKFPYGSQILTMDAGEVMKSSPRVRSGRVKIRPSVTFAATNP